MLNSVLLDFTVYEVEGDGFGNHFLRGEHQFDDDSTMAIGVFVPESATVGTKGEVLDFIREHPGAVARVVGALIKPGVIEASHIVQATTPLYSGLS